MPKELAMPPGAGSDDRACELVRAWAAHGGLQCSLNIDAWPEKDAAVAWGILLSDIARHVADAFERGRRVDKKQTLDQIRNVFNDELDRPTAETTGNFS
jgi:hypothetical protein